MAEVSPWSPFVFKELSRRGRLQGCPLPGTTICRVPAALLFHWRGSKSLSCLPGHGNMLEIVFAYVETLMAEALICPSPDYSNSSAHTSPSSAFWEDGLSWEDGLFWKDTPLGRGSCSLISSPCTGLSPDYAATFTMARNSFRGRVCSE